MAANEPSSKSSYTSEPPKASATNSSTSSSAISKPSLPPKAHSTTSAPTHTLRKSSSTNLALVASPPLVQSLRTSRNTSPIRKDRPASVSHAALSQPSAASIQRALSASNVTQLQYSTEAAAGRLSRPYKPSGAAVETVPYQSLSPRLQSPSATTSRRIPAAPSRKSDSPPAPLVNAPSMSSQGTSSSGSLTPTHSAPPTPRSVPSEQQTIADRSSQAYAPQPSSNSMATSSKAPSRGPTGKSTLETVQENSTDSLISPSPAATQASADLRPLTKISDDESREASRNDMDKSTHLGESGSESAGNRSDNNTRGRRSSAASVSSNLNTVRLKSAPPKPSYSLSNTKSRPPDSKNNMTVETETVQSIPQSALAAGDRSASGRPDIGGSVRLKPSTETIRPKKDRKKAERKARSINQGTATSKADLFEARVASAVDEANTSDSDETFVYESNPPEPHRRTQRHHSRTPSVTSSHSIADQPRGVARSFADTFDDRRVGGKRSMKFSRNPYADIDSPESNFGTVRSHTPRHIGRHGRGAASAGHHSTHLDPDTPHTHGSRVRSGHLSGGHGRTGPTSPHSGAHAAHSRPASLFGKKQEHSFDFDAEQNADDERQPLLTGSIRTVRASRSVHRCDDSMHRQEEYLFDNEGPKRMCGKRTTACVVTLIVMAVVFASAMGMLLAFNKPLHDVRVVKIQNVLASEQELMLDLLVGAANPNVLSVPISDMDMSVFAKSKFSAAVGDTTMRSSPGSRPRSRPASQHASKQSVVNTRSNPIPFQDPSGHWHTPDDGDADTETDPNSDVGKETQAILLGRVQHFDQPLLFEASPWRRREQRSIGGLRVEAPGNKTETDGSYHWDHVIEHPFELIVRGVLKYQLPISARAQNVAVSASVIVHPEDGIDRSGNMRVEPVDHSDHWQWIDWPDLYNEDDVLVSDE